MKIRVVSIISRMTVGGPALLIDGLIKGLPGEDFDHHLITGVCAANEIDYLDRHSELNNFIAIHKIESMSRSLLPIQDFRTLITTIRILHKIKPDIVHTHTSKAGIIGRLATIIASPKSRIVHTFHGHLLYGYFSPFKTKFVVILEKLLSRVTDVLIAVTSQIKQDLRDAGIGINNHWEIIHPGVNKVKRKNIVRLNEAQKHLVWIGRFTDIKNPKLAIEIMEILDKSNNLKVSLTMVGDGELLSDMRVIAFEKKLPIEFVGWQTDVYPFLQNSDALLLTSKNEGLPIVMLEAASMGIPTFCTDVGGVNSFITDGITGFLIDQNPELASKYISSALSNSEVMRSADLESGKKYQAGFSMDYFVKAHCKLYKFLVR
jgi:glycosyltransferase involved in cell wall biosynthesis